MTPAFFSDDSHILVNILWILVNILWSYVTNNYNKLDQIQQPRDSPCKLFPCQVAALRHLMIILCGINRDIDWFCKERQEQGTFRTQHKINQNCGFLRNLVNTNGMKKIMGAIRTMIPWLSFLKNHASPLPRYLLVKAHWIMHHCFSIK